MKRLAAFAVVVALSAVPVFAQHGSSHGGFSGSHSSSSGSHGGFSSSHSGFSGRAPAFHGGSNLVNRGGFGGARTSPSGRFAGPSQPVSQRMPYPGAGVRRAGPFGGSSRQLNSHSMNGRMPYRSPYGGDRRGNDRDRRGGRPRSRPLPIQQCLSVGRISVLARMGLGIPLPSGLLGQFRLTTIRSRLRITPRRSRPIPSTLRSHTTRPNPILQNRSNRRGLTRTPRPPLSPQPTSASISFAQ